MWVKAFVFGFVLAFSMTPQIAKRVLTGRDLLQKMNSQAESDQSYAAGCVAAIYEISIGSAPKSRQEMKKAMKIARDFLEANEKMLAQDATKLLKEAFLKYLKAERRKV